MALPSFKDVPPEWKHPFGPYRQAPPEYGGNWYLVNPFVSSEPWLNQAPQAEQTPPEFLETFGPLPHIRDPFYQEWRDNLKYFKGVKLPEYISQAQLNAANEIFVAWQMGKAVIYEGRYGFSARFPETGEYDFDIDARTAVTDSHFTVARFQIRLAQEGKTPARWHGYVPPQVYGGNPK